MVLKSFHEVTRNSAMAWKWVGLRTAENPTGTVQMANDQATLSLTI
jgi:hypothetical protein